MKTWWKNILAAVAVVFFIVCLLLFGLLGALSSSHAKLLYSLNQKRFETAAQQVLERGSAENIRYPNGVKDISLYTTRSGCVDFYMGGFGLVPSSTYWGVIYAAEDLPTGFQGLAVDFTREGEGWRWQEENGDNTCYVAKLADHWYWYEMSL